MVVSKQLFQSEKLINHTFSCGRRILWLIPHQGKSAESGQTMSEKSRFHLAAFPSTWLEKV
jgi:hypothetical protein